MICSTPESKEQILEDIIWNNRFIKSNGSSVYYKQWHEAGITKVSDIFKGDSLLTFNDFVSTFQLKTNFLKYYGLCHAIPQEWINLLKGKSGPITSSTNNNNKIYLDKISCKVASQMFVQKKFERPAAERRMKQAKVDIKWGFWLKIHFFILIKINRIFEVCDNFIRIKKRFCDFFGKIPKCIFFILIKINRIFEVCDNFIRIKKWILKKFQRK